MDTQSFIIAYREAFGADAPLPLVFWYSSEPAGGMHAKIPGCLFKCLKEAAGGTVVSLSSESIGCGGGKFYTGFTPMPPHVPEFVSLKERYKRDPESVRAFLDELRVPQAPATFLNLARADRTESFEGKEGILFLATPDILSGLLTWAYFDNNSPEAVSAPFGSGCCSVFTQAALENRRGGRRTFLGFFDPSVRPYVEENILSYTIPLARLRQMLATLHASCLFGTPAWQRVRARITREG